MKHLITGLAAALFALAAFAQTPAPNDAQIAAVLVAANNVDADAGRMAAAKAEHGEVRAFAQRMIQEHTALNRQLTALAKKLKLTPEENGTSRGMLRYNAVILKRINRLEGAEFDRAYIDNEVTHHEAVLEMIDKSLLPNAKKAELAKFLKNTRQAIDAHLQQAKKIQSSLQQ